MSADNSYDKRVDSLLNVAMKASGKDADSAYMEVGRSLAYVKPVDAIPYLIQAEELAIRNNNTKVLCMCYSFLGIAYSRIGSYDNALNYYNKQLNVAKENNINEEVAWANNHISLVMLNLKNYDLAGKYLEEARLVADSLHDDNLSQFIYSKIGILMQEIGRYELAVEYFGKVLEYRQKPPVDSIILSATYRDLGNVYFAMDRYTEAKYYYGISRRLVDSMVSDMSAAIDVNLAKMYRSEFQIDSALYCAHRAVSVARRFGDNPVLSDAFGVLGNMYYSLGLYHDAEKCMALQLSYQDSIKLSDVMSRIYNLQYQKQLMDQRRDIINVQTQNSDFKILLLVGFGLVALFIYFAIHLRYKRLTILNMNRQILYQNLQLNKSISYAKKIQKAVFPNFDNLGPNINQKFMLFRPKDEVSGNFYWAHTIGKYEMLALCDSGETGVPGAFMTMMGTSLMHEVAEIDYDPAKILDMMRSKVYQVMQRLKKTSDATKGVDVSLLVSDTTSNKIYYSGVKLPLLIIRDGNIILIQEHFDGKGFYDIEFKTTEISLEENDRIYMMTSGFISQRNREGIEISRQRLYNLLLEIHQQPVDIQKHLLAEFLDNWRGDCPQDRDVLISGGVFHKNDFNL